jgi:4-amino-4-deoxy-L-arabinose transferase-like glycosyltransferase
LFDSPAGFTYLLVLPWLLLRNVWALHALVGLVNVLPVPLLYNLLRRLRQGEAVAGLAALLCAASPWLIQFSMNLWPEAVAPALLALVFTLLSLALFGAGRRRARRLTGALVSLAVLTQMHLLVFFAAVQTAVVLALNRQRWAWRALLPGGAALLLATGVYGAALLAHWPDQANKLALFLHPPTSAPLPISSEALEHALRFVTGRDYEIVYGNDGSPAWQTRRAVSLAVSWALAGAAVLGLGLALWKVVRRRADAPFWGATLAWWGLPIAAFTVSSHSIHPYYLLLSLPAGFALAGLGLAWLLRPRALRWAVAAVLALGAWVNIDASARFALDRPARGTLSRLYWPAVQALQQAAAPLVEAQQLNEAYVEVDSSTLSANLGRDLTAVNWFSLPELEIFPLGRPALYIRFTRNQAAPALPLARPMGVLNFPYHDIITFDQVPAMSRAELSALPHNSVEWPSDTGLTLVGYDLAAPQALVVYWTVDSLEDGRFQWIYSPYVHFTNAAGQMAANLSAPGLQGYQYRLGDVYRYTFTVPDLPAGRYTLELGLVDGVHGGVGMTFLPPGETPGPFYTAPVVLP